MKLPAIAGVRMPAALERPRDSRPTRASPASSRARTSKTGAVSRNTFWKFRARWRASFHLVRKWLNPFGKRFYTRVRV
jgi:hypothetical protein